MRLGIRVSIFCQNNCFSQIINYLRNWIIIKRNSEAHTKSVKKCVPHFLFYERKFVLCLILVCKCGVEPTAC